MKSPTDKLSGKNMKSISTNECNLILLLANSFINWNPWILCLIHIIAKQCLQIKQSCTCFSYFIGLIKTEKLIRVNSWWFKSCPLEISFSLSFESWCSQGIFSQGISIKLMFMSHLSVKHLSLFITIRGVFYKFI